MIAIFYHVWQAPNWQNMFLEQISELRESGLLDAANYFQIGVNVYNNSQQPFPKFFGIDKAHIYYNENINHESDTLKSLWEFANKNENFDILYIHTKGLGNINCKYKKSWRKCLEFFLIKNWKLCIDKLKDHDCVGALWHDEQYPPHYSGNMWWSKSSYIKKLNPDFLYNDKIHMGIKYQSEFWIGTESPKYYNFYTKYLNTILYHKEEFDPKKYEKFARSKTFNKLLILNSKIENKKLIFLIGNKNEKQ